MKTSSRFPAGFTLVELMVSTAIIGLIMIVLVGMTNQTSQTWRNATEKIEKFQSARDGFESMTRKLAQATLNTNWDYLDSAGNVRDKNVGTTAFNNFVPIYYGRVSDLRFASGPMYAQTAVPLATNPASTFTGLSPAPDLVRPGHGIFFQAPFGVVTDTTNLGAMDNLLNTWGYFVEAGGDPSRPPFVDNANVPERWRTRLMEFMQPAEKMSLYDPTDKTYKWFTVGLTSPNRPVRVLAENILTLIILPKLSKADEDARAIKQGSQAAAMLTPQYIYDSQVTLNPGAIAGSDAGGINPKNQLPPVVMVTMIAVDDRSMQRLADKYCSNAQRAAQSSHGAQVIGSPSEMVMGMDQVFGGGYYNLFTNAAKLEDDPNTGTPGDGDLYQLETALSKAGITYRVFTSNVSIRGSKWSHVQTK